MTSPRSSPFYSIQVPLLVVWGPAEPRTSERTGMPIAWRTRCAWRTSRSTSSPNSSHRRTANQQFHLKQHTNCASLSWGGGSLSAMLSCSFQEPTEGTLLQAGHPIEHVRAIMLTIWHRHSHPSPGGNCVIIYAPETFGPVQGANPNEADVSRPRSWWYSSLPICPSATNRPSE
jgi:hypothetical protein